MQLLKSTLSGALGLTGKALSLTGGVLTTGVRLLRALPLPLPSPSQPAPEQREERPQPVSRAPVEPIVAAATDVAPAEIAERRGRIVEPPATPLLDETPHVRTSESHISELAAKSAGDVINAVDRLSTDELRLLIEHETAHRNRRTVLQAIEKALAPSVTTPTDVQRPARRPGPAKRKAADEIILPDAGGVPTSGSLSSAP
jgi:hypothetical protein